MTEQPPETGMTIEQAFEDIKRRMADDAAKHPRVRETRRHSDCYRYTYDPVGERWPRSGEVRRCEHGKVQLCYEIPPGTIAGCQAWRDISKFWNRGLYQEALKIIDNQQEDCGPHQ